MEELNFIPKEENNNDNLLNENQCQDTECQDTDCIKVENRQKEEKKGMFARLRDFIANKKEAAQKAAEEKAAEKAEKAAVKANKKTIGSSVRTLTETGSDDMRKFGEFLGAIETQLDKVEEQNESLIKQLSTLEKNNNMLLEQVSNLTKNNNQLAEQYNNMKKREKVAKIMAIVAASFSIGLAIFNVIFNIILPNI